MGTRADFYVGKNENQEWIGSIAYDGYPEGCLAEIKDLHSCDESDWRERVEKFLKERSDSTIIEQGWPWPWDNSATTDWAYTWEGGEIYCSSFGRAWIVLNDYLEEHDDNWWNEWDKMEKVSHPNMKHLQKIAMDHRSGLLIISS